jgi:hypothetical protein
VGRDPHRGGALPFLHRRDRAESAICCLGLEVAEQAGFYDQGAQVKGLRLPIAWLMAIVALAALNFGAFRAASDDPAGPDRLLCMAVLPMANVLAVGLLIGRRHRGSRRFLVGFEAFGAAAFAFVVAAILSGEGWVWSYVTLATGPLRATLGPTGGGKWSTFRLLGARSFLSLWATLPQLTLALTGGFASRKFGPPGGSTELGADGPSAADGEEPPRGLQALHGRSCGPPHPARR